MSKRRGNNEGSIYQIKNGRWVAAITIGYNKNGNPKRKVYYGRTRKEAQEKLVKAQHLFNTGKLTQKSLKNITLAEWLDTWLNVFKKNAVKATTFRSYQKIIELYIFPELGHVQLKNLSTPQIQMCINSLEVSPRTVQYAVTILRQALKQAQAQGYVNSNVAVNVALPRSTQGKARALTLEEIKKVFSIINNPIHYTIYYALLSTGVRRGELIALKWQDVNLENKVFNINNAVTKNVEGKWVVDSPKTAESIRAFTIPDKLVAVLKKHRSKQNKQILRARSLYNNQNFIFCRDDGERYDPDYISRRWKMYCDKVGIKSNLHELRHTFATLSLQGGVDVTTVSKMLGHRDVTTTLNVYSHILPNSTEKAASLINTLLP